MGFLNRLFGTENGGPERETRGAVLPSTDAQALERYRYMVRTAPPETIEQAHREAFERLTPEQRRQLLSELARAAPPHEQAALQATSSEDANGLARAATRAELRQPGTLERSLHGSGIGLGGSLLSSFAAGFVGSMVAQTFFSALGGMGDGFHGDGSHDRDDDDDRRPAAADRDESDSSDTADHDDHDDHDSDESDDFAGDDFGGGDDFDV